MNKQITIVDLVAFVLRVVLVCFVKNLHFSIVWESTNHTRYDPELCC